MGIFTKPKTNKPRRSESEVGAPTKTSGEEKKVRETAVSDSKRKLLVKQVWVTEKASNLSNFGKYIFVIDKSANKSEIKKAIESIYSVKVISVNIINSKGKSKRLGRSMGKTSAYKKAIITLKKGQKIDVVPT